MLGTNVLKIGTDLRFIQSSRATQLPPSCAIHIQLGTPKPPTALIQARETPQAVN